MLYGMCPNLKSNVYPDMMKSVPRFERPPELPNKHALPSDGLSFALPDGCSFSLELELTQLISRFSTHNTYYLLSVIL